MAAVTDDGRQATYDPVKGWVVPAKKKGPKKKGVTSRPQNNRQVLGQADPTGGVQSQAKGPQAAQAPGSLTAPAVKKPGLSAYERKRNGILDYLNDPAFAIQNEAFSANYDAARSQVENAFAQAMGEVQSRQAAGEGILGQMPGQIDANYGQAAANVGANNAALAQAQQNMGVQTYLAPGEATAPVTAAMGYEQAAAKANVPLLGVGLANLASQQRQGLASDRGSALADIASKEEDSRVASQQAQQDKANQMREYAQEQLIQSQLDEQDSKSKTGHPYGRSEINNNRGFYVANNNPEFANAVRSGQGTKHANDAYKAAHDAATALVSKGLGPNKLARQLNALIAKFRKDHPGMERAVSLGLFDVIGGQ